jgi:hypothetical protein
MQADWAGPGGSSGSRLVLNETLDLGPFIDNTVVAFRALSGSPSYEVGNVGGTGGGGGSGSGLVTGRTITVGVAYGFISDDRLNVSGTVTVTGTVALDASNSFQTPQFTVSTTAVQLLAADTASAKTTIQAGSQDLYIGTTSGVTTANGFLIPAGGSYTFSAGYTGDAWGISTASGTVYVLTEDF